MKQDIEWLSGLDNLKLPINNTQLQHIKALAHFGQMLTANNASPSISLQLKPVNLSANVLRFQLFLNDNVLTYRHGPERFSIINWPFFSPNNSIRVEFNALNHTLSQRQYNGPWALFKLLQHSMIHLIRVKNTYQVTIDQQGYLINYALIANKSTSALITIATQSNKLLHKLNVEK